MSEAEVERLRRKHADIRLHGGPEALNRQAEKKQRQAQLKAFATKHDIGCFKCGSKLNDWAKIGMHKSHHAWAICLSCVQKPRAASVPPGSAQNPANSDV